jgi:hypothetical protein
MKNKTSGLLSVPNLMMIAAFGLAACAHANPTAAPAPTQAASQRPSWPKLMPPRR